MGIKKYFNPAIFQGEWKTKNYFEEWFFKISDASEENTFIFVPGVSLGKNPEDFHTFIQIIDVANQSQHFQKFEIKDFVYSSGGFNIKMGDNIFSEHGITLKSDFAKGRINFRNVTKWPASILGRHSMRLKGFLPFLNSYHSVISMSLTLAGTLNIGGRTIDFTGGKGYIEKDWGKKFPPSWVWSQCSHFDAPKTSFSLFLARKPFFLATRREFLCTFLYEGRHTVFSTYNGSKLVKFEIKGNFIEAAFSKGGKLVEVTIEKNEAGLIPPLPDKKTGRISSTTLDSKIYLKYYKNSKLIFSGQGVKCGVETEGETISI